MQRQKSGEFWPPKFLPATNSANFAEFAGYFSPCHMEKLAPAAG
jgi:hypothetical protein